jgi:hypothetical protein
VSSFGTPSLGTAGETLYLKEKVRMEKWNAGMME